MAGCAVRVVDVHVYVGRRHPGIAGRFKQALDIVGPLLHGIVRRVFAGNFDRLLDQANERHLQGDSFLVLPFSPLPGYDREGESDKQ